MTYIEFGMLLTGLVAVTWVLVGVVVVVAELVDNWRRG